MDKHAQVLLVGQAGFEAFLAKEADRVQEFQTNHVTVQNILVLCACIRCHWLNLLCLFHECALEML